MTEYEDGKPETLLEKAKRCFKLACDAEAKQREREKEDLRFQIPENQWTDAAKKERAGGNGIPPRPMLSISRLDGPTQLILNQAREAKLGVKIHPVSERSNKETAEVIQGLYDRIQRDSNAAQARIWAFQRAVIAGRGWYRVNFKWDENSDPKYFDQEIVIERILHQDSVYADPSAQKADFSDGEWAFVVSWVPWDTFKRQYPECKLLKEQEKGGIAGLWSGLKDWITQEPEWVRANGESKDVLVAEYFYKVHTTEKISFGDRERERDVVTVKWAKLCGYDILDEEDWDGQYIPLIPVLGRELQPVEGERWWIGLYRHAIDAQRFFNTAATSLLERLLMEPKSPWVMPEGQDEGYEQEWNESNVRYRAVLHYKPTSLGEKLVPPPARAQLDMTGMSLAAQGVQMADEWLQANTAIYNPSLGKSGKDESGRKVLALQDQSNAGTSDFLSGLADVSMNYEGLVVVDLIPSKYDRPGRITQVLGEEEKQRTVMLNAPHVMKDGQPVEAQPGDPNAKIYDFTTRGYSTSVSVGRSFQTRLQEGKEAWSQLIPNLPPEAQIILLPTLMRFLDSPGSTEAADLMAKYRDMTFKGLADEEDGSSPEQIKAKLQATEQQMQLMGSQLQAAMKAIETEQVKQQAQLQKAQMDNEAKVALGKLDAQTEASQEQTKVMLQRMEEQFKAIQSALDRDHEERMQREKLAHEVGMASAGGTSKTFTREDGSESDQEQSKEAGREGSRESGTEESPRPETEA